MNALARMVGKRLAAALMGITEGMVSIHAVIGALNSDPEFSAKFVARPAFIWDDTIAIEAPNRRQLHAPGPEVGTIYPDGPTTMFVWRYGQWLL